MPFDRATLERPNLDSWGLPQSPAARRDADDMLARVGHGEIEGSRTPIAASRISCAMSGAASTMPSAASPKATGP